MRTLKYTALALLLAALAVPATAQSVISLQPEKVVGVGGLTGGDDADVALLIKYVGTAGTGVTASTTTVEVDANSINLLVTGAAATGIKCPSGGTDGEIDITNAACDTLGEIVDHINASASGYKAVILDGQRTDLAYSSDKKLLTTSATTGVIDDGVQLKWDSSTLLKAQRALLPPEARVFGFYQSGLKLIANPFERFRPVLTYFYTEASTCTAAGTFQLFEIKPGGDAQSGTGSESVSTVFQSNTSTTTTQFTYDFRPAPIVLRAGTKAVIKRNCATAFVNVSVGGNGYLVSK